MKRNILLYSLTFCLVNFICISFSYDESFAQQAKSIKVLSLNTGLMSVFFNTISIGLKKNKDRAQSLARVIQSMHGEEPDVIAFQEAFDKRRVRSYFYKNLKTIYPYSYFDDRLGSYLGGVSSGLIIFSKYPIKRKMIQDYDCWAGVEALARKGIMGVELDVDGCPFYLFTTHLQAGVDRDWYIRLFAAPRPRSCEGKSPNSLNSDEIRTVELRQARREIEKFVKSRDLLAIQAPILLVGDFNISRTREEDIYNKFKDIFFEALDTFEQREQVIKSTEWRYDKDRNPFYADTQTDRVDYAWLLNPKSVIKAESTITSLFTDTMTDHLGIIAEVTFSCPKN